MRTPAHHLPGVDVIVPCYNYGRYLAQCVDSVLTQADVDVRVLILDDASLDNTPEIGTELARADQRVTFQRHTENQGHISTYNEGIEWTSSEYLLLLSADDHLLPGALSRATALMDGAPQTGFVFGNALILGVNGSMSHMRPFGTKKLPGRRLIMSGTEFVDRSGAANIVPTPTAVVRTELQKRVGGYHHDLPHSGDLEMWLRLAARSSIGFVDADQAVYRQHAANMSLGYLAAMVPDIEQRTTAFERFFAESTQFLPDVAALRDKTFLKLARSAVGRASAAFNDGNMELCAQLLQLSESLSPKIVNSAPWLKLHLKRRIGLKGWRAINGLRRAVFEKSQSAS